MLKNFVYDTGNKFSYSFLQGCFSCPVHYLFNDDYSCSLQTMLWSKCSFAAVIDSFLFILFMIYS